MNTFSASFEAVLQKSIATILPCCKPVATSYRAILITAFLMRSRLNHQAIVTLTKNGLHTECAAHVRIQMEIRLRALVICSPFGDYAVALLRWHEELRNRLRFLGLEHLEAYSDAPQSLLAKTKQQDQQILLDWFGQKPKPKIEGEDWLHNWQLWNLERLLHEIRTHLIESPRVKKEVENLIAYASEHEVAANLSGIKRYVAIDEELNLLTFNPNGEERWEEGSIALSTAAILDLLADASAHFGLNLESDIEDCRARMNQGTFR